MGINKITSLFADNADALQGSSQRTKSNVSTDSTESKGAAAEEAVTLSRTLTSAPETSGNDDSRKARVLDLKSQVARGDYKPDYGEVAKSLIRDLF